MKSYSYQAIVEAISHLKEDGHTDVPSSIRMCMNIIEDAEDILAALQDTDMEESIDTWWTNKLAVAADSLNKLRDYYTVDVEDNQEIEETSLRPFNMNPIARRAAQALYTTNERTPAGRLVKDRGQIGTGPGIFNLKPKPFNPKSGQTP